MSPMQKDKCLVGQTFKTRKISEMHLSRGFSDLVVFGYMASKFFFAMSSFLQNDEVDLFPIRLDIFVVKWYKNS